MGDAWHTLLPTRNEARSREAGHSKKSSASTQQRPVMVSLEQLFAEKGNGRKMAMLGNFFRQNNRAKNPEPQVLRLLVKRSSGRKACLIEIRNDQSFTELDMAIRRTLDYDTWDHCSAFFEGAPWESRRLVEVYPDNSGPGQLKPISILTLIPGVKLGYVYDFGDNLLHSISVEDVLPVDLDKQYPSAPSVDHNQNSKRKKSGKGRRQNL